MGKRYALCVGINDYPGSGADLSGCVNDAYNWSNLLRTIGTNELATALDSAATKVAVVSLLEEYVAKARFGDRIYFTYSGHGSWVPDQDGDEADRRDEVLCLHDYQNGGLLSDDEMYSIFQKRRFGVRIYVVSDSCHSGTLSRLISMTPGYGRPRFMPPTQFLSAQELNQAARVQFRTFDSKPRPSTALLSGCSDTEYSYDAFIDGKPQGAFTAVAMKSWEPGISLSKWHGKIREELPNMSYPQSPQLQAVGWQRYWSF